MNILFLKYLKLLCSNPCKRWRHRAEIKRLGRMWKVLSQTKCFELQRLIYFPDYYHELAMIVHLVCFCADIFSGSCHRNSLSVDSNRKATNKSNWWNFIINFIWEDLRRAMEYMRITELETWSENIITCVLNLFKVWSGLKKSRLHVRVRCDENWNYRNLNKKCH